jgi:hypothetical protein
LISQLFKEIVAADSNDSNYHRLWKPRRICEMLDDAYSEYCDPSEHLAVTEIIVLLKAAIIIIKQYISRNMYFGIKIHKLYDMFGNTYDIDICHREDWNMCGCRYDSNTCSCKTLDRKGDMGIKVFFIYIYI